MSKNNRLIALLSVLAVAILVAVIYVQSTSQTEEMSGLTRISTYSSPLVQKASDSGGVTEKGVDSSVIEKVTIDLGYPKESVKLVEEAFESCFKTSKGTEEVFKCSDSIIQGYPNPVKGSLSYESNFATCIHTGKDATNCAEVESKLLDPKTITGVYDRCKASNEVTIMALSCIEKELSSGTGDIVLTKDGTIAPSYDEFVKEIEAAELSTDAVSPELTESNYLADPSLFLGTFDSALTQSVAPPTPEECNEDTAGTLNEMGLLCIGYEGDYYSYTACNEDVTTVPFDWACDEENGTWYRPSEVVEEICDASTVWTQNSDGDVCMSDYGAYWWDPCNSDTPLTYSGSKWYCKGPARPTDEIWHECNSYMDGRLALEYNNLSPMCFGDVEAWKICDSDHYGEKGPVNPANGYSEYACVNEDGGIWKKCDSATASASDGPDPDTGLACSFSEGWVICNDLGVCE